MAFRPRWQRPCGPARGLQEFNGVEFDVRGLIQLAGTGESHLHQAFAARVNGIQVNRTATRLHFLLGAAWTAKDGVQVGHVVVRYRDGRHRLIPIIYGYDFRNWWPELNEGVEDSGLKVAWAGRSEVQSEVRLYQKDWVNPLPEVEIQALDLASSMSPCAPFLIALTVE